MKKINFEPGFIETIEKHNGLNYTDTDSIYVSFKHDDISKLDKSNWDEIIDRAINLADTINAKIDTFAKTQLTERANIDPDYQTLYFKTEAVALKMIQFPVKKTYALAYIYDEGKRLSSPKVKKTGGHIKKSSTPLISKDIINEIYNVMLFKEVKTISELHSIIFTDLYQKYTKKFREAFEAFDFSYIGIPYKYGFSTKTLTKWVWGAMFFNTFFHDELRPGASMYSLSIKYNPNKLRNWLQKTKINNSRYKLAAQMIEPKYDMISVPVGYNIEDNFHSKFKELEELFDLRLSYDHNFDFDVKKKFEQFLPFFK